MAMAAPMRTRMPIPPMPIQTPTSRIGMADPAVLYRLMTWLSPAYPIGTYTYSHGLEAAVTDGFVEDCTSAEAWIRACVTLGAGRNDAIMFAHAWRAEKQVSSEPSETSDLCELDELTELIEALSPSAERLHETSAQGEAFAKVTSTVWDGGGPAPYPIAVGRAAARHGIGLEDALTAYLHGFAANLVSAAVRLVPLGQVQGQSIMAALMEDLLATARETKAAGLHDLGGLTLASDIASIRHETQDVRLFRT